MKKLVQTVSLILLCGLISCAQTPEEPTVAPQPDPAVAPAPPGKKKKIKLAILLDTSGSMSGLLEQAKNQLWKIVNQLAKAKDDQGEDPEIELALYQYGNDGLSITNGYVQQISGFTSELDEISEQLFALTTNGGSEYCGTVIKTSLQELQWSDSQEDLQLIFIAGNEPFTQGEISYYSACSMANEQSVVINTIFCGEYQQGIQTYWKDGADRGNGKYLNIDHDAQIVHINTPYDTSITALNSQLNNTYVPYGAQGAIKKQKQLSQDANAQSYGSANTAKRVISKAGKVYKNKYWDLVDAADEKDFEIKNVPTQELPEQMRTMTDEQKKAYITQQKQERLAVKQRIKQLSSKREEYVQNEKAKRAEGDVNQLDDAIIEAIVDQAMEKSFSFEKDQ